MEQQGNNHKEANRVSTFGKVKDNIKDKVQRVKTKLHANSEADGNHSEHDNSHSNVDRSNFEDFPYDGTGEDEFTLEMASIAHEQRDEVVAPCLKTLDLTISGLSWTLAEKTTAGLGIDEVVSQEVLDPYKHVGSVQALEAVPTDYRDSASANISE